MLTAISDANGQFVFPDLPAGSYRIAIDPSTVPAELDLVTATSFTFDLDPGQNRSLIDFPLVPIIVPVTGSQPSCSVGSRHCCSVLASCCSRRRDRGAGCGPDQQCADPRSTRAGTGIGCSDGRTGHATFLGPPAG